MQCKHLYIVTVQFIRHMHVFTYTFHIKRAITYFSARCCCSKFRITHFT